MIPTWGKTGGGASLALDFVNSNSLPSSVTFSRGTAATQYDSTGALIYSPMNAIRNNTMVGAVAGTPGTPPTNWGISGLGTLTQTISTGVSDGINYIDVRLSGTTSTTQLTIRLESQNGAPALVGQTWTLSTWAALVAGSMTNISGVGGNANVYDSVPAYVGGVTFSGFSFNVSNSTLTRASGSGAIAASTAAYIQPQIYVNFSSGVAIDITLRIGMPQLQLGSTATAVNATSGTAYYGPRFDYDPSSLVYQNLLTYSEQFENAVWQRSNVSIATNTAVAPNGNSTADTLAGTGVGGSYIYVGATLTKGVAYTFSVYVKDAALGTNQITLRDFTDPGNAVFDIVNQAAPVVTGTASSATMTAVGSGWYRLSVVFTPTIATGNHNLGITLNTTLTTSSFYVWGAQLNTGSTALPYYATTSAAYTQCAPRGLLIEEARTNSIRNNTMQGAVAGTPGTAPTNWVIPGTVNGLTQTLSIGTEDGISYIDFRYAGTTSAASSHQVSFEAANQIAAASGQTWARSAWFKIAAGSTANVIINHILQGRDAANTTFTETFATDITSSLTGTLTRNSIASTLANASTAFTRSAVAFVYNSGVAVDITLRIGLPQLELGAFATSVIPTFGSTATRNADTASMTGTNFSSWYNATQGTLYSEVTAPQTFAYFPPQVSIHDGTTSNYLINDFSSGGAPRYERAAGGVTASPMNASPAVSAGALVKQASAYALNDFAFVANAGTPVTSASGNVPTVTKLRIGGYLDSVGAGSLLNGYIRSIRYYPTRLPNATLQGLTV